MGGGRGVWGLPPPSCNNQRAWLSNAYAPVQAGGSRTPSSCSSARPRKMVARNGGSAAAEVGAACATVCSAAMDQSARSSSNRALPLSVPP